MLGTVAPESGDGDDAGEAAGLGAAVAGEVLAAGGAVAAGVVMAVGVGGGLEQATPAASTRAMSLSLSLRKLRRDPMLDGAVQASRADRV